MQHNFKGAAGEPFARGGHDLDSDSSALPYVVPRKDSNGKRSVKKNRIEWETHYTLRDRSVSSRICLLVKKGSLPAQTRLVVTLCSRPCAIPARAFVVTLSPSFPFSPSLPSPPLLTHTLIRTLPSPLGPSNTSTTQ